MFHHIPFLGPIKEFRYEFVSKSDKKEVIKIVRFSETELENTFNLVLLDSMPDGSESNDTTETKNKDLEVVMATMINITSDFLNKNFDSFVYIEGSDERRKRLYQIILNREYENLISEFHIFGGNGQQTEIFKKGKSYEFFFISKRLNDEKKQYTR